MNDSDKTTETKESPLPKFLAASQMFLNMLPGISGALAYYGGRVDQSTGQAFEEKHKWEHRAAVAKAEAERVAVIAEERAAAIEWRAYMVEHNNHFDEHCSRTEARNIEHHKEMIAVVKQGFADIVAAIKPQ